MLAGTRWLPRGLDQLTRRLRSSPGHVGLLTALGANSPEITTGITALASNAHDAGYGVVFGSDVFNLFGLLAVGALIAGRVAVHRQALALHGLIGVAIALLAAALVAGWLAPAVVGVAVAVVFVPYVVLLGLDHDKLLKLPAGEFLASATSHERERHPDHRQMDRPPWGVIARTLLPALLAVIVGGIGVMRATLDLAEQLSISRFLIGVLLLAFLTGLPNVATAVHLARSGRGDAVLSETLNSNMLNLIVGVVLAAVVVGIGDVRGRVDVAAWWLLGMTLAALILSANRSGLGRPGALVISALYLAFVVVTALALVS